MSILGKIFKDKPFHSFNDFNCSPENRSKCSVFDELNKKYISLFNLYSGSYENLTQDLEERVRKVEYSKGGETLHGGYYSPSVKDLIVGNSERGYLLKNPTKENCFNYRYLFDEQGNLICTQKFDVPMNEKSQSETTVFLHHHNAILGISFGVIGEPSITCITECTYSDDKLIRYEYAVYSLVNMSYCRNIQVEELHYKDDLFYSLDSYDYNPKLSSLHHSRYTFDRDKDGYLSSYLAEDIYAFNKRPSQRYDVLVKRK